MTVTVERGRAVAEEGRDGGTRRPRADRDSYALFLLPGALAFLAVVVVPFLMNTGVSFTDWQGVGGPEWSGLANYRELLDDSAFWASFRHSLFMVVAMAAVPTALGLVLAAALFDFVGTHFGSRVTAVLRACFYLPQVLPIAVAGIVWSWILAPENGSLNELLKAVGLGGWQQDWLGDPDLALYTVMAVMVWVQLGFPLVVFMAGLQRVDPALYEAAELDGAGWWRRFRHITLPQIRPEIHVVLLWCTIAALKVFGAVYVLTKGGPGGATDVPSYFSFTTFFEKTQVGYGAAISTVLTVIVLALALVGLRLQTRAEDAEEGARP
ncbi:MULTISPECIES: carbohydrate ABC transporter permease [Streptomyces]|uniref:carbohydrate ABC transporter permease n=1 Tax=Streptomyces TaxID=1883 RepID=UPI000BC3E5F7|nr:MULTISPECIES: sugar ABC transporter permease [Streptomyces]MDX2556764.1 sugar ABC transporter permease [Streptomyces stelliscabiei]MDX2615849.1 sugar ABC transporter permease [Streptomyces stelliscabiei]MDX2640509.1 sugar ABC transporter permease [Streptomyces stelliscabiei]MDX2666722.1 sugar ABC transporter permease [Streptomyces stelliscabiei]MDX2716550.1 sugar ABC transporter permease [Streptomyces stelliscabiei]